MAFTSSLIHGARDADRITPSDGVEKVPVARSANLLVDDVTSPDTVTGHFMRVQNGRTSPPVAKCQVKTSVRITSSTTGAGARKMESPAPESTT
jgi:hypothetical protein